MVQIAQAPLGDRFRRQTRAALPLQTQFKAGDNRVRIFEFSLRHR
jgi:hypothetical protein